MPTTGGVDDVHLCEALREGMDGKTTCGRPTTKVALDMGHIVPTYRYFCADCHDAWKLEQLTGDHLT